MTSCGRIERMFVWYLEWACDVISGGKTTRSRHDTPFVQRFEPDRVLLMPDGAVDVWSEDYLDLVALD
jgi:hypothetical protein